MAGRSRSTRVRRGRGGGRALLRAAARRWCSRTRSSPQRPDPARERARLIHPPYADGPLVKAARAANQPEAELLQALLLDADGAVARPPLRRLGRADFLAARPRDILAPEGGAAVARDWCSGSASRGRPRRGPRRGSGCSRSSSRCVRDRAGRGERPRRHPLTRRVRQGVARREAARPTASGHAGGGDDRRQRRLQRASRDRRRARRAPPQPGEQGNRDRLDGRWGDADAGASPPPRHAAEHERADRGGPDADARSRRSSSRRRRRSRRHSRTGPRGHGDAHDQHRQARARRLPAASAAVAACRNEPRLGLSERDADDDPRLREAEALQLGRSERHERVAARRRPRAGRGRGCPTAGTHRPQRARRRQRAQRGSGEREPGERQRARRPAAWPAGAPRGAPPARRRGPRRGAAGCPPRPPSATGARLRSPRHRPRARTAGRGAGRRTPSARSSSRQ